jgi:hypothetical protein
LETKEKPVKRLLAIPLALATALVVAVPVRADEATKAIFEKAIKAYGGNEKLAAQKHLYLRSKGTLELPGLGSTNFNQEIWLKETGKMKDVMQLDVMGMQINVTTVYNGEKVWVNANGMTMELDQEIYGREFKEVTHLMKVMRLAFVGDKSIEVSIAGEAKVEDRPAVGVRLSSKGYKDVTLYFDKESGLITRVDRMALDASTGQDVAEERIIKEYQVIDGLKTAKKILLNRDGKKFLEAEVLELKMLAEIDDSEFKMP